MAAFDTANSSSRARSAQTHIRAVRKTVITIFPTLMRLTIQLKASQTAEMPTNRAVAPGVRQGPPIEAGGRAGFAPHLRFVFPQLFNNCSNGGVCTLMHGRYQDSSKLRLIDASGKSGVFCYRDASGFFADDNTGRIGAAGNSDSRAVPGAKLRTFYGARFGKWELDVCSNDSIGANNDGHIVQGGPREEYGSKQFCRDGGVDSDACFDELTESDSVFDDDYGADFGGSK